MVEGDSVFKEAIQFLKSTPPLKPLQWDENLHQSALDHVNDIDQKVYYYIKAQTAQSLKIVYQSTEIILKV